MRTPNEIDRLVKETGCSRRTAQRRIREMKEAAETAVELSPFVVNAGSDVGYVASSTLSGSRLNTPLRDTAASINAGSMLYVAGSISMNTGVAPQ